MNLKAKYWDFRFRHSRCYLCRKSPATFTGERKGMKRLWSCEMHTYMLVGKLYDR